MAKKRWAAEVNDEQFAWLKAVAEEGQKTGGADFNGSVVIQELIEQARAEDPKALVRRLAHSFLQRRVASLQAQLDGLSRGEKEEKHINPLPDALRQKKAPARAEAEKGS